MSHDQNIDADSIAF